MLLVQVQLAQLSPHGVMVAALDLGSSGRTGRKSSSLFVGIMLMWAQVAKGNDCKSYDIFPPGVRFPPSTRKIFYGELVYGELAELANAPDNIESKIISCRSSVGRAED